MKKPFSKIIILFILLFFQVLLVRLLAQFPGFITQFYTEGLYSYLSSFQRYVFGFFGFPLGDLVYALLIIIGLYWLILLLKSRLKGVKVFLYRILLVCNIFYFSFHFFWGINYYKYPFSKQFNLTPQQITNQGLFDITALFIKKTNELREQLQEDEKGVFKNKNTLAPMATVVSKAYDTLGKKIGLESYVKKPLYISWYSRWISYLGMGGYYNPFFGSAQVNSTIPTMDYGMVISHEMTHQYGFASEKEANYMAFLNCLNSHNKDMQYSAYYNTLWRFLYEVYKIDREKFKVFRKQLSERVERDRKADILHHKKYRGKLNDIFSKANDLYLKSNGQKGTSSYSKYTQLVLNQYVAEKNNTAKWRVILR